jgi:zinc finger protein 274
MGLFGCEYKGCSKSFASKFSMKRHMLLHEGKKQFVCKFCMKSFILRQYLKEHIFTHTGAKPYHCKYPGCGKSFRQAGKLSIHRKTHIREQEKNEDAADAQCSSPGNAGK